MTTKGSRTRQRIVEEAIQLFSRKGYFNTSVQDLLDATGLTKGGLYGHFPSKAHVWDAAYERSVEVWRGIVFDGVREADDPLERVFRVIDNDLYRYVGQEVFQGGCFFLNTLVELAGQSDPMSRRILGGFRRFSRLLESWLREASAAGRLRSDAPCDEAAEFILTTLNGAAALYAATRDHRLLDATARQLRRYVESFRPRSNGGPP